jgi:predicted metal-binding membrane protein
MRVVRASALWPAGIWEAVQDDQRGDLPAHPKPMATQDDGFDRLDTGGRAIASLASRPRIAVWATVGGTALLAWAILAAMAAETVRLAPGGPGSWIVERLPGLGLPWLGKLVDICLTPIGPGGASVPVFAAIAAMWMLMSLAMMLPSAAPLIRTYCEIAETAAAKGERAVHPSVLVTGYMSVWLAASLAFAGMSLAAASLSGGAPAFTPTVGFAGAAALAIAGLYQFSGLKDACLKKCRRPFSILFAKWSTRTAAIFRLGVEQGVWCLGCCWALMLVMFAVGLMNIAWMALIALFALVEKETRGHLATRLAGAILLVWSAALLVLSVSVA